MSMQASTGGEPEGDGGVNYIYTGIVSGVASVVTLTLMVLLFYHIHVAKTWKKHRRIRVILGIETQEDLELAKKEAELAELAKIKIEEEAEGTELKETRDGNSNKLPPPLISKSKPPGESVGISEETDGLDFTQVSDILGPSVLVDTSGRSAVLPRRKNNKFNEEEFEESVDFLMDDSSSYEEEVDSNSDKQSDNDTSTGNGDFTMKEESPDDYDGDIHGIDKEIGQDIIKRWEKDIDATTSGANKNPAARHLKLIYQETHKTRNPLSSQWKCIWCGNDYNFENVLTSKLICKARTSSSGLGLSLGTGFAGSSVSHQRHNTNGISLDVIPLEIYNQNKSVFMGRVFAFYRNYGDLFLTPKLKSADSIKPNGESTRSFNVVDAYFEYIHPWTYYDDIAWATKSRKQEIIPPSIEDLAPFLGSMASTMITMTDGTEFNFGPDREYESARATSATPSSANEYLPMRWILGSSSAGDSAVSHDPASRKLPMTIWYMPFVVFKTDVY